MSITLKRAKLLAETNPDIKFFMGAQTSGSSGFSMMGSIDDVIRHSKWAEDEDYVLYISPLFPDEMERKK